ncbi:unnamed protein product [Rodentolepis nana]|uniref:Peptidase_S8 domain-containing protein n=1 Tax=Rodentolepis nana TaxID=102285 RepID=A0A0R3TL17_RODNA|nr:unnamed protein product [Rodentolepis nana]
MGVELVISANENVHVDLCPTTTNTKFLISIKAIFSLSSACVDTSPYEDTPTTIADLPLLKDFSIGRQYAHFGNDTLLYFTVKILNDGDLLQIVTNSGSHATHVASIAAAYYPTDSSHEHFQTSHLVEDGNQNGIAPGAQVVSIKIANTSLKGMETISSLLTALNWTSKLNCDVINYSFGEKTFLPNFGRMNTHLSKFVSQTDVAFVTSGGNSGPSLGTVGSPGGSVDGLIAVAPILSPTMMKYMYMQPTWEKQKEEEEVNEDADCSAKDRNKKMPTSRPTFIRNEHNLLAVVGYPPPLNSSSPVPSAYCWGSRGPSVDGDLGLTVAACGGAIADVAAWKRTIFDLHNGSSMSSPSVAGALALVLSALRQSERQPTLRVPFILWRAAIFSCSKPLPHLSQLDQGAGMFQVGETYEYLRNIIRDQSSSSCPSPSNQIVPSPNATHVDRYYGWRLNCHVNGPGCIVENSKGLYCRGIWLRSGWLPNQVSCSKSYVQPKMSFSVDLEPVFCDASLNYLKSKSAVSAEFKRNFSLNLSIQVGYHSIIDENDIKRPKHPDWLCVAPFIMLPGRSRRLALFIDPTAFPGHKDSLPELEFNPPSKILHTCLAFVNADSQQHEPLAYLPITIQLPTLAQLDRENGVYTFGFVGDFFFTQKVCRWFVRIPRGSTAGVLRFQRTDGDGDTPSAFALSVVLPKSIGSALGTGEEVCNRRINLIARNAGGVGFTSRSSTPLTYESSNGEFVFAFPISWVSETVEITLAQHPGSDTPDRCQIQGKLDFHGLEIRPEKLVFHLPQTYFPIDLRSNFGHETIKFEMESKFWIQPLRPTSTSRSYKKLVAYEKGFFGLPGLHCLTLTYYFDAPFKSDNIVFDFRRLTSLLYESDVVQTVYYVYDSYGRFYGHGSYQVIYVADTMKMCHYGKESDMLDKLASFSLLIRWPLNLSSSQLSSTSTPPLTFELSSSLATLSLADVDYEKSCSRLLLLNANASNEILEVRANLDSVPKGNKKDPLIGKLQVFPTIPWHLAAGESITEYFGIIDENLASFVSPGSYFECQMSYYGHRDLKKSVKLPLEIIVGPRNPPSMTTNVKSPLKGVFGLQAEDLLYFRWIALGHFGLSDSYKYWISAFEIKQRENPPKQKKQNKDGGAEKSKPPKDEFQSHVLKFFQTVESCSVFDPNRLEVWEKVNLAMKELTVRVVEMAESGSLDESLKYLLPKDGNALIASCDDSALKSRIPVLIYNQATTIAENTADVSVESAGNEIASTATKKIKQMSAKQLANRATAIEVLCTYGRCLCEQIALAPKSAPIYRNMFLDCLREIISRIHYLFLLSNAEPESIHRPMRNFFDCEDTKSAATLGLTVPLVEKIKPSFELFWLAHLFVLHPQLPLLEALTRLSYQIDNISTKGSYQSLLRNADPARDRIATDCASIAFPWMIKQLERMGLPNIAHHLEYQLPSMFPRFDYNLVLSEQSQPNMP